MASEGHLGGFIIADDQHPVGDRSTYETRIWKHVFGLLRLRSVLDIGCGQGFALEFLANRGYRVLGIDGAKLAKELNRRPDLVQLHDFVSGPVEPPGSPYDAVWCCEVVEHIAEPSLPNLLQTFRHSGARYVFMTHAFPGQEGYHHVNCQTSQYWIGQMATIGYRHAPLLTLFARKLSTGFFKRGLVFRRTQ